MYTLLCLMCFDLHCACTSFFVHVCNSFLMLTTSLHIQLIVCCPSFCVHKHIDSAHCLDAYVACEFIDYYIRPHSQMLLLTPSHQHSSPSKRFHFLSCVLCYTYWRPVSGLVGAYSLLFVTVYRAVCYLLLHAVQFAICCCMLCNLLFVAACRAVCYLLLHAVQFAICCCMPCSLLFVAACRAVCYLLLHAVQFAICCCMPCSLLFCCRMPCSLLFVAACCAICYLLLHAVQFAICCRMLCSLLFVATHYIACSLLPLLQHSIIWGKLGAVKLA